MLEANVSQEGVLKMQVPDRYRGKRVRISIRSTDDSASSQWNALTRILDQLDELDITRRSHEQILNDLRAEREAL